MSTEQRETLDAILRQSAFPAGGDVHEQRRLLKELLSTQPLPPDVTVTPGELVSTTNCVRPRWRSESRGDVLAKTIR